MSLLCAVSSAAVGGASALTPTRPRNASLDGLRKLLWVMLSLTASPSTYVLPDNASLDGVVWTWKQNHCTTQSHRFRALSQEGGLPHPMNDMGSGPSGLPFSAIPAALPILPRSRTNHMTRVVDPQHLQILEGLQLSPYWLHVDCFSLFVQNIMPAYLPLSFIFFLLWPTPWNATLVRCIECSNHSRDAAYAPRVERSRAAAGMSALMPPPPSNPPAHRPNQCRPCAPAVLYYFTTLQIWAARGGRERQRKGRLGQQAGCLDSKGKGNTGSPAEKATVPCWCRTHVANGGIFISPDTKGVRTQSQSDDSGVWMGSGLDKDDVQLGSGFDKADPRVALNAKKDARDQA
ncbi:hypothetical protein K438DRAFT_1767846 [Mycena galopus ATCC 62051]|nr:hypothetical protein K438DRAFT_1767846 [Mycena galopus ATCC 62051]